MKWVRAWLIQQNDVRTKQRHRSAYQSDRNFFCAPMGNTNLLHTVGKDSDQTGWVPMLIWVLAERIGHFVGSVMLQFKWERTNLARRGRRWRSQCWCSTTLRRCILTARWADRCDRWTATGTTGRTVRGSRVGHVLESWWYMRSPEIIKNKIQVICAILEWCFMNEPHHEKTCLQGFLPVKTRTGLLSCRD